jgi:hypothetical protein
MRERRAAPAGRITAPAPRKPPKSEPAPMRGDAQTALGKTIAESPICDRQPLIRQSASARRPDPPLALFCKRNELC